MLSSILLSSLGLPEILVRGLILTLIFLPLILGIIAVTSCIKSNFRNPNNKTVWVIVILLVPVIGSILYFIISPKQRIP